MQQINTIQYLRGLAALSVVVFHVSERYQLGFGVGAAGVDLFFVISGVIMWVTTDRSLVSPALFMSRRIRRVVPLYWLVTCVTFVALALKPDFFFGHDGSWHNLFYSLTFLPSQATGLHPVVVQGWTLTYEMIFYVVFAVALLLTGTARLLTALVALAAICLASYAIPSSYLAIAGNPVMLEFGAGLTIGWTWCRGHLLPAGIAWTVAVVAIMMVAFSPEIASEAHRAIKWGIPSAGLVLAIISLERTFSQRPSRFLLLLGNASYSLYLWHVLFDIVILACLLRSGLPNVLFAPIEITGVLGFSLLAYKVIEKPMQAFFNKRRLTTDGAAGVSAIA